LSQHARPRWKSDRATTSGRMGGWNTHASWESVRGRIMGCGVPESPSATHLSSASTVWRRSGGGGAYLTYLTRLRVLELQAPLWAVLSLALLLSLLSLLLSLLPVWRA